MLSHTFTSFSKDSFYHRMLVISLESEASLLTKNMHMMSVHEIRRYHRVYHIIIY